MKTSRIVWLHLGLLPWLAAMGQDTQCARVVMEIKQEVTLERQAFDAHMRIHNGSLGRLEQVDIDLIFKDEAGNLEVGTSDANNKQAAFFVRLDSADGVSDVNGRGMIAPNSVADIHWLLIPTVGAGGSAPQGRLHYVGARIRYVVAGEENSREVIPDSITVLPMPKLVLDYFLPKQVYGDDAFTEAVEPPVPFDLGVRVKNIGYGKASKVTIKSAQPKILENEQDLLIGFKIKGSHVNNEPAKETLLVEFGDILSQKAKVAGWIMECTLSGRFVEMETYFTHADSLGGELTSLIEAVNPHLMVRQVLVDLTGRDAVTDFLAEDGTNGLLRVYESDGLDTPVTNCSAQATWVQVGQADDLLIYRLSVPPMAGPFFARYEINSLDRHELVRVRRSIDGRQISLYNGWVSKERERYQTKWKWHVNLFDVNSGGDYLFTFRAPPFMENRAPVLQFIGRKVTRVGQQLGFFMQASDPDGTVPVLAMAGLPAGATFTNNQPGQAEFHWIPTAADYGVHPVKVTAGDGEYTVYEVVKLYVGQTNEALDGSGLPLSLSGWQPRITNALASTTSGNATMVWNGVSAVPYEFYYSDEPYSGGMVWRKLGQSEGSSGVDMFLDASIGVQRDQRFYKVVLEGDAPNTNAVYGVIRRPVQARNYTMLAPPLRSDMKFNGVMGAELAAALTGHGGGVGDGIGDEVYLLQPNGSWRILYLDGSKTWRESDGQVSSYQLSPGQAFFVARHDGTEAKVTFTGAVGNDATRTNRVVTGWNMVGLSEGKSIPIQKAFATTAGGQPYGGSYEEDADLIAIYTTNKVWRRLMFVDGWGAPYDGKWFDLTTFNISTYQIQPGDALYYYRHPVAGEMKVIY